MTALSLDVGSARAEEPGQETPPAPQAFLHLDEVLASVAAHYPLLRAVETERDIASGSLRSARGSFDTRVIADGDLRPAGTYESYSADARVEQQTRLWGAKLYGGYRIGSGDFASYDGGQQTDESGEVRGGIELPLLRGGAIDDSRARLARDLVEVERVEPEIDLQQIGFKRAATLAYWSWLSEGLTVGVERQLLEVAEKRQSQLEGRVRRGAIPSIDLTDNERLIVDRQIRLVGAERDARQASIDLSLFLRSPNGVPLIAEPERMPRAFPPEELPDEETYARDIEWATREHPLLQRFSLEREQLEVDVELARNELLPSLGLRVEGSQDLGSSDPGISSEGSISRAPRNDTEVKALLRFELPVQQRAARGRLVAAQARLSRLSARERFARERIEAEILLARAGIEAAFSQTGSARRNRELAVKLQRAEERKLALGTSNLINVNIREIQAANAARDLIETQAAFFRALADYRAAVGGRL